MQGARIAMVAGLLVGCAPRAGVDAGLALDAGAMDAAVADAGTDAGSGTDAGAGTDAGTDAALDAGRDAAADAAMDAGTDAGRDADADAGTDAGSDAGMDAGMDASLPDAGDRTVVKLECVPVVPGNELNSGMVLSDAFWPGFRFQVLPGPDLSVSGIGLNVRTSSAGTVFGAIVRLTAMSDTPDSRDLTSADVLATTIIALPGGAASTTMSAPISATLAPGWYAAVFGTGAFGATLASATVHSNSGAGGCGSGFGFPFSIRQSDGMLILQGATPHFVVEGLR